METEVAVDRALALGRTCGCKPFYSRALVIQYKSSTKSFNDFVLLLLYTYYVEKELGGANNLSVLNY